MLLFGIFVLLIGLFFYLIKRHLMHPGVIFNVWWGIILIIDSFNQYNLVALSKECMLYVIIGVMMFNLGIIFYYLIKGSNKRRINIYNKLEIDFYKKKVYNYLLIIQCIIFLFLIPMLIKVIPLYINGQISEIRSAATTGEFADGSTFMSTFERLLYIHWIIFPLTKASFVIIAILWFLGKIKNRLFVFSILNMIIIVVLSGGRLPAFFGVIMLFFIIYFLKKYDIMKKENLKEKKKIAVLVIIIALIYIIGNGLARSTEITTVFTSLKKSIITYFTGGLHFFSYILDRKSWFGLDQKSFGIISFRSIFYIFSQVLYYLSGKTIPLLSSRFSLASIDATYLIGDNVLFNAFPTAFYYSIRDFGLFGVIVMPLLLAIVATAFFQRLERKLSIGNLIALMECCFLIIFSVCTWMFYKQEYLMQLIYYFIILKLIMSRSNRRSVLND